MRANRIAVVLVWLAPGVALQAQTRVQRIAQDAVNKATGLAEGTIASNKSDVEAAKAEINAADNRSAARRIAYRYVHGIRRHSHETQKSIQRLVVEARHDLDNAGADGKLIRQVVVACQEQFNRTRDSRYASEAEIKAAAGMPSGSWPPG